jgi:hypothetical protein
MPNDEWCTPPHIAAAARIVLGGIDFDPFSSPQGNESIKASKYWTKKDDAFAAPWPVHSNSSVWMNPPYSRVLIVEAVNTFSDISYRLVSEGSSWSIIRQKQAGSIGCFGMLIQFVCSGNEFTFFSTGKSIEIIGRGK